MSEHGVFAVCRGIWSDPDFAREPFTEREAFLWIVSEASWKDRPARGARGPVDLKRGELCHSVRFMAGAWGWSKSRVGRFLDRLKNRDTLRDTSRGGERVLFVSNYSRFQIVGLPERDADRDRRRDASGTPAGQTRRREDSSSSLRSEEEMAKTRARRGSRVDGFEPDIAVALEIGLSATEARREAEIFRDFWRGKAGQHGVKADWLATWRNWCRKAVDRRPAPRTFKRTIDEHGNDDGSSDERGGGGYFAKEAALRRRQFAEREARSANEADRAGGSDLPRWDEA